MEDEIDLIIGNEEKEAEFKRASSETLPIGFPIWLIGSSVDECIDICYFEDKPTVVAALTIAADSCMQLRNFPSTKFVLMVAIWSMLRTEIRHAILNSK